MSENMRLVPTKDGKYDIIIETNEEEFGEEFSKWLEIKQQSLYSSIVAFLETKGKKVAINTVKIVAGGAVLASFFMPRAALGLASPSGGFSSNPLSRLIPKNDD